MEFPVKFSQKDAVTDGFYYGHYFLKPTNNMIGLWFMSGKRVLYEGDHEEGCKFYQIIRITPKKVWVKEYECKIVRKAKKNYTDIDESIYGIASLGIETGEKFLVGIKGVCVDGEMSPIIRFEGVNHSLYKEVPTFTWFFHPRAKIQN